MTDTYKRHVACKLRIGAILSGRPLIEADRLKTVEINGKQIIRINVIANIVDKYIQEGEKKFGSLTLDDGTGQIKAKAFGDDVDKLNAFNQGDTILIIGFIRLWNNELYILPEIFKKKEPAYLLLRKQEIEAELPKSLDTSQRGALKDNILEMVKNAEKEGGIDIDKLILELKEHPDTINQEIKKLLEDGVAYEPRPGKIRYLG